MSKNISSIFNDVIGPIMRGPSSSHVAGAERIANLLRQSIAGTISKVIVDFDINGSLAESYHGHGTDIGFASGILGIPISDPRVPKAVNIAKEKGIDILFNILDYGAVHPNNYRMEIFDDKGNSRKWEAISVGGGMIEIQKIEHFNISICGDYYELIVLTDNSTIQIEEIKKFIIENIDDYDYLYDQVYEDKGLVNVKLDKEFDHSLITKLNNMSGIFDVISLKPILPTHSSVKCEVPFRNASELASYNEQNCSMWELAALYESRRGNTTVDKVYNQMSEIVSVMYNCIEEGLNGTEYSDRILGQQAYKIEEANKKNLLIPSDILNNIIASITAIMEVKSSMGVIVAAPTAGSCGCLPGTIIGTAKTLNFSKDDVVKAMLASGLIGAFFANEATFAAEVAGCQVECGAGSGMAAAGIVQLLNGSAQQCLDAASMALQNITGLACDPVANRVEVPCLGKNIMGGANAIVSANMILAGFDKVIPLDETIKAIYDIGQKLPLELRCTYGGLGKTQTSLKIRNHLL